MYNTENRRRRLAMIAALVVGGPVLVGATTPGAVATGPEPGSTPSGARCVASPLFTADVRSVERVAAKLVAAPEVRAARRAIAREWRSKFETKVGPLTEQNEQRLRVATRELVFTYAQRAANSDSARPKVSWTEAPPHTWGRKTVQGSRYAGDNPDTIYRIVPVDGVSDYVIHGRLGKKPPAHAVLELTDDGDRVVATDTIELKDLATRPDGRFTITIGPDADNGRRNHLQTNPKTVQLFIRDTLSNWGTQTPMALEVERVAGPKSKPPAFAELVQTTVDTARSSGTLWMDYFVLLSSFSTAPNVVPEPAKGVASISRSTGNFDLAADQALVITTRKGPATYTGATAQDVWTITPDYWRQQTGLSSGQSVPNADGTTTLVLAPRDPGVRNWISTGGLRQGTFLLRWQGASLLGDSSTAPYVESQVVKASDLRSVLPKGTAYVTAAQRKRQLSDRRAGFERRVETCQLH